MNLKECLKPHPLLHTITGAGIGLIVANLVLSGDLGLVIGVVLVLAGFLAEIMAK